MDQKKVVGNNAGDEQRLILNNGWEILKTEWGYTLSHSQVFIHGDAIKFGTLSKDNAWLNVFQDNVYIASLWIDNAVEIKKINEFIKGE